MVVLHLLSSCLSLLRSQLIVLEFMGFVLSEPLHLIFILKESLACRRLTSAFKIGDGTRLENVVMFTQTYCCELSLKGMIIGPRDLLEEDLSLKIIYVIDVNMMP